MAGRRFGRLTVLSYTGTKTENRDRIWLCKCDCGHYVRVRGSLLRSGDTSSCGCLRSETSSKNMKKVVRRSKPAPVIVDNEPLKDDDLWMFGDFHAVRRLQKMFK